MKTNKFLPVLCLATAMLLGACGSNPGTSSAGPTPVNDNFDITSDTETPYDFHTESQKNFLAYDKGYYNITKDELTAFNATGKAVGGVDMSLPNAYKLEWEYNGDIEAVKNFSVIYGQKEDLSDGYEVKGTSATSLDIYNTFLGTNYFKVVAHLDDDSTDESAIRTFEITTDGPRNLKVGNMTNCRDMGGRTTYDGGTIKQGLIYRTCGNKYDYNTVIDDEGKAQMLDNFGVKTEINLSDNQNYNFTSVLSGITTHDCYMDYGNIPYSNLARNAEVIRKVFSILGNEENYPVFYHCRIGTDRTGIVGICLNGLIGVTFDETMQDYGFSNFGQIGDQRYSHKASDPNGDDAAKYIDEIRKMPGDNFQQQTYNALRSCGVPASDLDAIIDIMTDGTKPNNQNGQIFTTAEAFTNNGGTANTASDYKHPNNYITITNGQSVSATVTTEAKEYTVVAYIGSTESSSSTKLSAGFSYSIDGAAQTIANDKTYATAGFGSTKQNGRTGYMYQILGKMSFTAGSHTIEIAGKSSAKFNVAGIHLIPGMVVVD